MRKHYPLNSNGAEDAGKLPWTDGVPATGVEGSYPGQALFTDTEAEILAAIDASGQTRNGSDLTQLIQAIARGIYVGQFGGTPNTLICALPNNVVFASLVRGIRLGGFVTATNATVNGSAGVTVALTGIGPVTAPVTITAPLLRKNGSALQVGDLPVNQDFDIRWDGSAFRMVGAVASDGASSTDVLPPATLALLGKTFTQAGDTSGYAANTNYTVPLQNTAADFGTMTNGVFTFSKSGLYVIAWEFWATVSLASTATVGFFPYLLYTPNGGSPVTIAPDGNTNGPANPVGESVSSTTVRQFNAGDTLAFKFSLTPGASINSATVLVATTMSMLRAR